MLTSTNISFCDSAQVTQSMALSSVVLSISSVGGVGHVWSRSWEATWLKLVFRHWRGLAFCYGFADFCNKLFIKTVDSVICFLCQCVTCPRCMQASNFNEDIFATWKRIFLNVSTAWLVSCGDGRRHFRKVIKKRSIRPCPWSMSMTRRAANGTCVAPCKEKDVFVEILRMFSVAHL